MKPFCIEELDLGPGHCGLNDYFLVHISTDEANTAEAVVYDAEENYHNGVKEVLYVSGEHCAETSTQPEKDSRIMFVTRCDWKGCWDERSYPKDQEYWSGEIEKMAKAEKMIIPLLRAALQVASGRTLED